MIEALKTLVNATVKASLIKVLQPWRFEFDVAAGRMPLVLFETRGLTSMNACPCQSRIKCGAARKNVPPVAQQHGWKACLIPIELPISFTVEMYHLRPERGSRKFGLLEYYPEGSRHGR